MASAQLIASTVVGLAATFGRRYEGPELEAALEVYRAALLDVPDQLLARALTAAAKSCKFMPAPAELRELALGKDWRTREEVGRSVTETDQRLRQLEAVPATAEEIARARAEYRALVGDLSASKDVATLPAREHVISEDEKAAALRRMEMQLALRGAMG